MQTNKLLLLQLSLMDSAEISLSRNPVAVNGAAGPGRYVRMLSRTVMLAVVALLLTTSGAFASVSERL